jgi:hypothetical protein
MEFYYAWLLILITLVGWQDHGDYQWMRASIRGNGSTRYANLWNTKNKSRQIDNNVTFYVYFDTIRYIIEHTPRIIAQMIETYQDIMCFKARIHHMYIYDKRDLA